MRACTKKEIYSLASLHLVMGCIIHARQWTEGAAATAYWFTGVNREARKETAMQIREGVVVEDICSLQIHARGETQEQRFGAEMGRWDELHSEQSGLDHSSGEAWGVRRGSNGRGPDSATADSGEPGVRDCVHGRLIGGLRGNWFVWIKLIARGFTTTEGN